MKNKKFLLVSLVALLAILLSACAGAVTETSAQPADVQNANAPAAPGVEASLSNTNPQQDPQNGKGGRGERDLTAAAEALGVTVEELQLALQNAKPAECADQTTQPAQGVDCHPDMNAVAESLGVTVEELQAALGKSGRGET
jgi:Spy/CpxP family protein refolding chaperone